MQRFFKNTHASKQAGLSLLSVMIAVFISGLVVKAAFAQLISTNESIGSFMRNTEINNIRFYIEGYLDCEETIAKANKCKSGDFIALASKHEGRKNLIPKYTGNAGNNLITYGNYQLRALCQECRDCTNGKKIVVEFRDKRNIGKNKTKANDWSDISTGLAPIKCALN